MKIKHKKLGVELEVEMPRMFATFGRHQNEGPYYKTVGGSFIAHGDTEWEVVQEKWEDVTSEINEDYHHDDYLALWHEKATQSAKRPHYRLRKVKVCYAKVQDCTGNAITDKTIAGWAFLVERKVS